MNPQSHRLHLRPNRHGSTPGRDLPPLSPYPLPLPLSPLYLPLSLPLSQSALGRRTGRSMTSSSSSGPDR